MVNKRKTILDAAVRCAEVNGIEKLTYQMVSAQCNLRPNAIVWYFPSVSDLKQATIDHAVVNRNLSVVAQGAVLGYDVPRGTAMEAINYIAERYTTDV